MIAAACTLLDLARVARDNRASRCMCNECVRAQVSSSGGTRRRVRMFGAHPPSPGPAARWSGSAAGTGSWPGWASPRRRVRPRPGRRRAGRHGEQSRCRRQRGGKRRRRCWQGGEAHMQLVNAAHKHARAAAGEARKRSGTAASVSGAAQGCGSLARRPGCSPQGGSQQSGLASGLLAGSDASALHSAGGSEGRGGHGSAGGDKGMSVRRETARDLTWLSAVWRGCRWARKQAR